MFSGDIGSPGHPIVRDPAPPPRSDYVVMETTYGDRLHRSLEDSVEELWQAVQRHAPARRQRDHSDLRAGAEPGDLFFLREGIDRGRLPQSLPVFLDSPMAISATEIMRRHPECFDEDARHALRRRRSVRPARPALFARGRGFDGAQPHQRRRRDHGRLRHVHGGRVRHHLRHNLWRARIQRDLRRVMPREGTLARKIIDGARAVRIFDEEVTVSARIYTINGFSAHADQAELLRLARATGQPAMTFLVHGDPDHGMKSMAEVLSQRGRPTMRPALHQSVALE